MSIVFEGYGSIPISEQIHQLGIGGALPALMGYVDKTGNSMVIFGDGDGTVEATITDFLAGMQTQHLTINNSDLLATHNDEFPPAILDPTINAMRILARQRYSGQILLAQTSANEAKEESHVFISIMDHPFSLQKPNTAIIKTDI